MPRVKQSWRLQSLKAHRDKTLACFAKNLQEICKTSTRNLQDPPQLSFYLFIML
jgi:hypothetical protein